MTRENRARGSKSSRPPPPKLTTLHYGQYNIEYFVVKNEVQEHYLTSLGEYFDAEIITSDQMAAFIHFYRYIQDSIIRVTKSSESISGACYSTSHQSFLRHCTCVCNSKKFPCSSMFVYVYVHVCRSSWWTTARWLASSPRRIC